MGRVEKLAIFDGYIELAFDPLFINFFELLNGHGLDVFVVVVGVLFAVEVDIANAYALHTFKQYEK